MPSGRINPVRGKVAGGLRKSETPKSSVDGRYYPEATEKELNRLAHQVFNTVPGTEFLNYLRTITMHSINTPQEMSTEGLWHMEGQRFIVGVLLQRAKLGKVE